jgi:hypothetical protein
MADEDVDGGSPVSEREPFFNRCQGGRNRLQALAAMLIVKYALHLQKVKYKHAPLII